MDAFSVVKDWLYRGYTLRKASIWQGVTREHPRPAPNFQVGFWMIIRDGRRIDAALTLPGARRMVRLMTNVKMTGEAA